MNGFIVDFGTNKSLSIIKYKFNMWILKVCHGSVNFFNYKVWQHQMRCLKIRNALELSL